MVSRFCRISNYFLAIISPDNNAFIIPMPLAKHTSFIIREIPFRLIRILTSDCIKFYIPKNNFPPHSNKLIIISSLQPN